MLMGYEVPIDIPTQSIYDKGMMQLYLQALQKDYEQGREDWNKFLDKYGDTLNSSIEGANEAYYQAGVGGALNKIENWEKRYGTPAIRSIQGRGLIERAIREADRSKMNTIRSSAENKQKYDESVRQLKLANKWNPEMERLELQRLGMDPNNWDHSRLWDRISAEPYTDYSTYFADQFKNLPTVQKEIKDPKTGEVIGRINGVDEDALRNIINVAYPTYVNTPSGRYELEHMKSQMKMLPGYQNMTDDQLNEALEKVMKDNLFKMGNKSSDYQLDPLYKMKKDLQNELSLIGAKEASEKRVISYRHNIENSNPLMWKEIDNSPSHQVTIKHDDYDRNNVEPVSRRLRPSQDGSGYAVSDIKDVKYDSNGKSVTSTGKYDAIVFKSYGTFSGTGKPSDGYKEHGELVGQTWVPGNGKTKGHYKSTTIASGVYVDVRQRKHNYGRSK